MTDTLDAIDRRIINALQEGFPISPRPFADMGAELGLSEADLIARIERLKETRTITRFGPFFDAAAMGGAFALCAMEVPEDQFDDVLILVNARPEVAHNYERTHRLNMWFVIATETKEDIERVVQSLQKETGLRIYAFPKEEEYFIGFRVAA